MKSILFALFDDERCWQSFMSVSCMAPPIWLTVSWRCWHCVWLFMIGSLLSPLGMAAMHTHGAVDMDEDRVPGGVVGKSQYANSAHMYYLLRHYHVNISKADISLSLCMNYSSRRFSAKC